MDTPPPFHPTFQLSLEINGSFLWWLLRIKPVPGWREAWAWAWA